MLYLDNNATTQVHPDVLEAMLPYLKDQYFNPSSGYRAAKKIDEAIERARASVAALISAEPEEIIFTSGGTESNNMALKWLARAYRRPSKFVTTAIEHSAVLKPSEAFSKAGFQVAIAKVHSDGRLDLDNFTTQITDASFTSVMWANNETGIIQPIHEAIALAKQAGLATHCDATQAVGKIAVDVKQLAVDYLTLSGHKFHAPKGVGALFIRKGLAFEPLVRGGGQEFDKRSGTENVAGIVAMGKAAELMKQRIDSGEAELISQKRDRLQSILLDQLEGVTINGALEHRLPNTLHVSFEHCEAAGLLILLDEYGVACSSGSACMTGKQQASHVQKAMGFSDEKANSSLRLALSMFTSDDDIERAAAAIVKAVKKLRSVQAGGVGPVVVYTP